MQIPESFKLNGQTVKVEVVDEIAGKYGYYNDVKQVICIAKTIRDGDEVIKLSQAQMETTFWHEVFHAFQERTKGKYSEEESSRYSWLMVELINSSRIEIPSDETVNN